MSDIRGLSELPGGRRTPYFRLASFLVSLAGKNSRLDFPKTLPVRVLTNPGAVEPLRERQLHSIVTMHRP